MTTKLELVDKLYSKLDIKHSDAVEIVESLFEMIKSNLEQGRDVKLPGIGKFSFKSKPTRIGRNPKTWSFMPM